MATSAEPPWLEAAGHAAPHAAHLCWWCWGVEHFASMTCHWLVRSHARGLSLCVAAPLGYLEAMDKALARFPEVQAACRRVELDRSGWAAALGGSRPAATRAVMVVAAPVSTVVAAFHVSGPAGLEELRQLEVAADRLSRGGSAVVCAYDAKLLSTMDDTPARAVVELALSHHPWVLEAGKAIARGDPGDAGDPERGSSHGAGSREEPGHP